MTESLFGSSSSSTTNYNSAAQAQKMMSQMVLAAPSTNRGKAASLANSLLAKSGAKSSEQFVKELEPKFANYEDGDLAALYLGCRSYPLKKSEFAKVVASSMEKSKNNMLSLGLTSDQIEASKPRKNYIAKSQQLEIVLERLFWSKGVDEKCLNWGTLFQCKDMVEFANVIHAAVFNRPNPDFKQAFYLNGYWSHMKASDVELEMDNRIKVILWFCFNTGPNGVNAAVFDAKGAAVKVDKSAYADLMTKSNGIWTPTDWPNINKANLSDLVANTDKLSLRVLLDMAFVVDPRKALQNKDYKLMKTKGELSKAKAYKEKVASWCLVIVAAAGFLGKTNNTVEMSLKVGSPFVEQYYNCRQFIHTAVRTIKRELYGSSGGADTRSVDEDIVTIAFDTDEAVRKYGITTKPK